MFYLLHFALEQVACRNFLQFKNRIIEHLFNQLENAERSQIMDKPIKISENIFWIGVLIIS